MVPEIQIQIENIDAYLKGLLRKIPVHGFPDDESVLWNIGYLYRLRAIGQYLLTASSDMFIENLRKSVSVRLHYLLGCEAGKTGNSAFYSTLKNNAYLDALAMNDSESASKLARLCQGRWDEATQYEDDYLFMNILQWLHLYGVGGDTRELQQMLERFQEVVENVSSAQLDLCAALAKKMDIDDALEQFLTVRMNNFSKLDARNSLPPFIRALEPSIDILGLAIYRLAEGLGAPIEREFSVVPSPLVAIDADLTNSQPDWRTT